MSNTYVSSGTGLTYVLAIGAEDYISNNALVSVGCNMLLGDIFNMTTIDSMPFHLLKLDTPVAKGYEIWFFPWPTIYALDTTPILSYQVIIETELSHSLTNYLETLIVEHHNAASVSLESTVSEITGTRVVTEINFVVLDKNNYSYIIFDFPSVEPDLTIVANSRVSFFVKH